MLGELIGKIFIFFLTVQAELFMFDTTAHSVETHVKSFGALPAHVAVKDAVVGRAVGLDRCGRLRVAHFDEGRADGNSLMSVEGNHSSFGLCGGSHDGADILTFGDYRSIRGGSRPDVGWWWIVAQVVVARSATARFEMKKIRCVAVNVEAHVASV